MSKFWIFLTSVWQEAKKLNGPTKKELLKFHIGSFVILVVVSVYLFLVDFGLVQFFTHLVYPFFLGIPASPSP
jgi:SecE/Sec61-gamma subunits of protein translocation complex.